MLKLSNPILTITSPAIRNAHCPFCIIFIFTTIISLQSCTHFPSKINDSISQQLRAATVVVYHYDDNEIPLHTSGFDSFYNNIRNGFGGAAEMARRRREAANARLEADPGMKELNESFNRVPEERARIGLGYDRAGSKRFYNGFIKADGKEYRMIIAEGAEGNCISIRLINDDGLEIGFLYHNGYCTATDRKTTTTETTGGLMSTEVVHSWQRELYLLAGDEVTEGAYYRNDNTVSPQKYEYKKYELKKGMGGDMVRQAYYYLYLAKQVLYGNYANCAATQTEVTGGNEAVKAFDERWIKPYIQAHRSQTEQKLDGVYFTLWIDSSGTPEIIPQSITLACENYIPQQCGKLDIEQYKKDIAALVMAHINELRFEPKQHKCQKLRSRLELRVTLDDDFNGYYEENEYRYPGE